MVMSSGSLSVTPDFAWLSRTYRPSPQEVETYAELIAAAENPQLKSAETLRHEAELQLWVWHTEMHQRPLRGTPRRKTP